MSKEYREDLGDLSQRIKAQEEKSRSLEDFLNTIVGTVDDHSEQIYELKSIRPVSVMSPDEVQRAISKAIDTKELEQSISRIAKEKEKSLEKANLTVLFVAALFVIVLSLALRLYHSTVHLRVAEKILSLDSPFFSNAKVALDVIDRGQQHAAEARRFYRILVQPSRQEEEILHSIRAAGLPIKLVDGVKEVTDGDAIVMLAHFVDKNGTCRCLILEESGALKVTEPIGIWKFRRIVRKKGLDRLPIDGFFNTETRSWSRY